jgi:DNA-binding protein HU-beta
MNKTELVEKVAFDMGLSRAESKAIFEHTIELMVESLAAGDDVSITGFASMKVVDRPAKRYRHNGTGKMMEVPAGKRIKVSMSDKVIKRIDPAFDAEKIEVED